MKRFLIYFFFLAVNFLSADYSFTQYYWVSAASGTTSSLYSVYFTNQNTGFVAGTGGVLRVTTNGGDYWYPVVSNTTYTLYDIEFVSQQTGWTAGSGGTIRKTTNGGINWVTQSSGTLWAFYGMHFLNASTGWLSGYGGLIKKTTNGGTNWINQTSNTYDDLNSVFFLDSLTGFATGYNGITLKTTNGGENWVNNVIFGTTMNAVYFVNMNTGWIIGNSGYIYRTTNQGAEWVRQLINTTASFYGIHFNKYDTVDYKGWIVGSGGVIRKTTNSGMNWVTETSGTTQTLRSIYFYDSTKGWTAGFTGTILKTRPNISGINGNNNITADDFYLHQNYPNPFNPVTKIRADVPEGSAVTLTVFDLSGKEVIKLAEDLNVTGSYREFIFDGTGLSSGIYFYQLKSGDVLLNRKMILLK